MLSRYKHYSALARERPLCKKNALKRLERCTLCHWDLAILGRSPLYCTLPTRLAPNALLLHTSSSLPLRASSTRSECMWRFLLALLLKNLHFVCLSVLDGCCWCFGLELDHRRGLELSTRRVLYRFVILFHKNFCTLFYIHNAFYIIWWCVFFINRMQLALIFHFFFFTKCRY